VGLCTVVTLVVGYSGCCERLAVEFRPYGSQERLGRKEVKLDVHYTTW
jgi:hypothetical protein